jgi:hypothetical protein
VPGSPTKKWAFASRFRRDAFGWRSRPAVARVKEAVVEIRNIARDDPTLAAEGAVLFLTKVSAALAHVDGSSGAIGTAVKRAIGALVPIIARATEDEAIRGRWLDRLWRALEEDEVPYIESLGEFWGDLCGSEATASAWADRLLDATGDALDRTAGEFRYFVGTAPCLSALFRARRYSELIELVGEYKFWPYRRWAADALVALGQKGEALRAAESCRSGFGPEPRIDRYCEKLLLSSGLKDEAYRRYGLTANRSGTRLAWFRAVVKKYPDRSEAEILEDLVALTPKDEGTWFAAAKSAGLCDRALELAKSSPCDPRTLTRAARDFLDRNPAFALESGLTAMHWMAHGIGFEINEADVVAAYSCTLRAAGRLNRESEARNRVRGMLSGDASKRKLVGRMVERLLAAGVNCRCC